MASPRRFRARTGWRPPLKRRRLPAIPLTGLVVPQQDTIGITDSVSAVAVEGREFTDAIGITDDVLVGVGIFQEHPSDQVGITDDMQATMGGAHTRFPVDSIGLTDTVALSLQSSVRTFADAVGITDEMAAVLIEVDPGLVSRLFGEGTFGQCLFGGLDLQFCQAVVVRPCPQLVAVASSPRDRIRQLDCSGVC